MFLPRANAAMISSGASNIILGRRGSAADFITVMPPGRSLYDAMQCTVSCLAAVVDIAFGRHIISCHDDDAMQVQVSSNARSTDMVMPIYAPIRARQARTHFVDAICSEL